MIYRRIAWRYANALFRAASAARATDQVERDLEAARARIAADPALARVLRHPEIPMPRKEHIIQAALPGRAPLAVSFLKLLVRRRRQAYLDAVVEEYGRLADEARRLVRAQAASAVPLTREQEQRLRQALEQYTGKTVQLTTGVDPSLLAGLVISVNDTVIDASARGRLETMRERLASARFRGLGR